MCGDEKWRTSAQTVFPLTSSFSRSPRGSTPQWRDASKSGRTLLSSSRLLSLLSLLAQPCWLFATSCWTQGTCWLAMRRAQTRRAYKANSRTQQPDVSETVKDKNASSARSKTAKDKTRDKIVTRALGPDVVNDKGQRIPFSRRGWEFPGRDDDDGDKTRTSPRASRPAKPGLPMPIT